MKKSIFPILCCFLLAVACSNQQEKPPELIPVKSRYTKTSTYADVMKVVDYARENAKNMHYEVFGHSEEGKDLPLLIFSDRVVKTPEQAQQLNRPIVLIEANIHAGEVEGKEALLRLIEELTQGQYQKWFDHITLLLAPIFNADGNERLSVKHRVRQYGPPSVGTRANAKGLNLNRDFTKLATSEAQGMVGNVISKWDPTLFMDLHTTDGSYKAYQLTYAPPLNPNTDPRIEHFERQIMLPSLRQQMTEKGWVTFTFGNYYNNQPRKGYYTYSSQPRYGTNYIGLRNRLGLLSETYSYEDYKDRIQLDYDYVVATLRFMAKHAGEVSSLINTLNKDYQSYSDTLRAGITFQMTQNPTPFQLPIAIMDSVYKEKTGGYMMKRMGIKDTVTSKLYDRFVATEYRHIPYAYALDNRSGEYDNLIENLNLHGINFKKIDTAVKVKVKRFNVSKVKKIHDYEKRQIINLEGSFKPETLSLKDWILIPTSNSNRMLIFTLLEPESKDGYVAWHMMGGQELASEPFPVVKLMGKVF